MAVPEAQIVCDERLVEHKGLQEYGKLWPQARLILDDARDFAGKPFEPRIRLACLRLASGKIENLRKSIEDAASDSRDVLWWAEYPKTSATGPFRSEESRIESQQNFEVYAQWLFDDSPDELARARRNFEAYIAETAKAEVGDAPRSVILLTLVQLPRFPDPL